MPRIARATERRRPPLKADGGRCTMPRPPEAEAPQEGTHTHTHVLVLLDRRTSLQCLSGPWVAQLGYCGPVCNWYMAKIPLIPVMRFLSSARDRDHVASIADRQAKYWLSAEELGDPVKQHRAQHAGSPSGIDSGYIHNVQQ